MAAISRILMTADSLGGVWTYALELARGLDGYGIEVILATMGSRLSEHQRADARGVPNLRICESGYRLEWMEEPWCDVEEAGRWLLELRDRWQPGLVHLNGYAHGDLPWGVPLLVAAHSCVLSWWRAVRREEAPPEWNRYRDAATRGLQAAAMVVAPSRAMLDEVLRGYGPLREARVVPNGCDIPARSAGNRQPFILSAGRLWDEAKNIGALDAVASRLDWPVYVAGEANHPNGGAYSSSNLLVLGKMPADLLLILMSTAGIYALPARYEPFGLTALEAALSGCALVLGDISSLREIWSDAALFVRPNDRDGLATTLNALARNDALRLNMAERSRRRALEFTRARMSAAYLEAYRRILPD